MKNKQTPAWGFSWLFFYLNAVAGSQEILALQDALSESVDVFGQIPPSLGHSS